MSKKEVKQNINKVPVVTILGHVDHGKTTLLDKIRESNVQECEVGGITQKVSVFTVDLQNERRITFVDTPGHEAFDLMRSRGGSIADIVLLIVAADDSVKPQTKESIEIIKSSTAKPIVVINKSDLPNINVEKVKRDIVNAGLLIEGMGGDIPVVEVSAKTGKGIDELLEMISLLAEIEEVGNTEELPKGVIGKFVVLETVKDKYKGNVSSGILLQGNLKKGDFIGYSIDGNSNIEKVKAMISEDCCNIENMTNGCGGKIIGLSNILPLGIEIYVLESNDIKLLNSLIKVQEEEEVVDDGELDFDSFFVENEKEEGDKFLEVIIKSSSQGSLEAVRNSLGKLEEDEFKVKIISEGIGNISLQDIERASVSKAIVLGFEVGMESGVKDFAQKKGILVRSYEIIYKLIEEISDALVMLSSPKETEEEIGKAVVRTVFVLSDGTPVLGSRVTEGKMKRDCKVYIVRNDEIVTEGKIKSLRINKKIVTEVNKNEECGISLDINVDPKEGDEVYCYKVIR